MGQQGVGLLCTPSHRQAQWVSGARSGALTQLDWSKLVLLGSQPGSQVAQQDALGYFTWLQLVCLLRFCINL